MWVPREGERFTGNILLGALQQLVQLQQLLRLHDLVLHRGGRLLLLLLLQLLRQQQVLNLRCISLALQIMRLSVTIWAPFNRSVPSE